MRRWRSGRQALAAACLLGLLGSGCTPSDPPITSPTPITPSASPTPTENAQEREQRLAYEAAEKSYRDFSAEYRRVTGAGGSKTPTLKMTENAAGPYLRDTTKIIKAFKETGSYTTGSASFGYIRDSGFSTNSLLLDVCEDETSVRTFNSHRKQIAVNGILVLQLEVHKIDGRWKLWDYTGQKAKSCK